MLLQIEEIDGRMKFRRGVFVKKVIEEKYGQFSYLKMRFFKDRESKLFFRKEKLEMYQWEKSNEK